MLILAYHRVNPEIRDGLSISPRMLRQQLTSLRQRGWVNVVLEEALDDPSLMVAPRHFAITFDDGYQDNHFHAAPVLQDLGMRATVYVVSSYIDSTTPFPWVRPHGSASFDDNDLHMTTSQLEEGMERGSFVYGSHTRTHPLLSRLNPDRAAEEIEGSRSDLKRHLGVHVRTFCYPAGDFDAANVEMVKKAGYEAAVVTPNRHIPETAHTLHRVGIYSHITPRLFATKIHPLFVRAQKSTAFWTMRRRIRKTRSRAGRGR